MFSFFKWVTIRVEITLWFDDELWQCRYRIFCFLDVYVAVDVVEFFVHIVRAHKLNLQHLRLLGVVSFQLARF